MTRARRCDASARPMAAVVRRGEESSSEEEEEEEENDLLDPSSPSKSVSRASASVASSKAKGCVDDERARDDEKDERDERDERDARAIDRENVAPNGDFGRARGAHARATVDFGRNVPNTKLVAACVSALRAAPIARAASAAEARERDVGILSQTSASMTSVNAHAREAALAARETSDALRRLTEIRFGRDDDREDEES